jgi:NOL1/NOP2/sun family putative RNA methylase
MNFFLNRYIQQGHDIDHSKVKIRDALRINTLKISEDSLLTRLKKNKVKLEKIPFTKYGYYYSADFSLGSTLEYLQGYYYLQEAASQVAVEILDPKENEIILDMCAAPGGKTSQISQYTNNKATIIALDLKRERLEALKNNLQRMGCTNVVCYNKDARYVDDIGIKFDKILLDAPCSGNFVTDNDWFNKRDLAGIKTNARHQKELLKIAVKVLKPNGTIVYSTCSLELEEDEEIVD